jgi:hypothetical protein
MIVLLSLSVLGCQESRNTHVPKDLIGKWVTNAPKYEDRYLELTENMIYFGTGGKTFDFDPIGKISMTPQGKRVLYTISYYHIEGQEFKLSFFHDPKRQTLALKNQPRIIWTKGRT